MVENPKKLQSDTPAKETPSELPLHYIKSNFHRVIHADGIYGGGTPTLGNIVMHLFSHRIPWPEKAFNDAFGREIVEKRISKPGIENEIEVSVIMDLNTARLMRQWLDSTIRNSEAQLANREK